MLMLKHIFKRPFKKEKNFDEPESKNKEDY